MLKDSNIDARKRMFEHILYLEHENIFLASSYNFVITFETRLRYLKLTIRLKCLRIETFDAVIYRGKV